jgi:hypothetical protein
MSVEWNNLSSGRITSTAAALTTDNGFAQKISIDDSAVCFYYRLNTGKEVIENI